MKKRIIQSVLLLVFIARFSGPLLAQSLYSVTWERDGYILGGGGAAAIGGFLIDRSVTPLSTNDISVLSRESINAFDRSATYNYSESAGTTSDFLRNTLIVAPLALFLDHSIRADWETILVMYSEVGALVGATNYTLKGTIKRIRPFVYNPDTPLEKKISSDARKSFFSGHTIITFASAVFLSTVYSDYYPESQWKYYIWAGSLITASSVGFLRYEAGQHFPTDILVGVIVGSAIGYGIPWIHRNKSEEVSLIPHASYAEYGFTLRLKF